MSLQPWRREGQPLYKTERTLTLGSGSYGTVKVAKVEGSFARVAMKSISLLDSNGRWSSSRAESVWHEVRHLLHLMERIDRPRQSFICDVHGIFYDVVPNQVHIVMELADRTLFSRDATIRKFQ